VGFYYLIALLDHYTILLIVYYLIVLYVYYFIMTRMRSLGSYVITRRVRGKKKGAFRLD
jgi:hypothetical protein